MNLARVAQQTYLALVHYPVYDRHRRVVATAITNLDIHDIARSSRTYQLAGYFLVHPVTAQRELADRITRDWGYWRKTKDDEEDPSDHRREALALIRIVPALEDAVAWITQKEGVPPLRVATHARARGATVTAGELVQEQEHTRRPLLLVFGTGWGLTDEVIASTDRFLEPIYGPDGPDGYNHLSVRSAAGIILDRLFGRPAAVSGEQRT